MLKNSKIIQKQEKLGKKLNESKTILGDKKIKAPIFNYIAFFTQGNIIGNCG